MDGGLEAMPKYSLKEFLEDYGCDSIDEVLADEELNGSNGTCPAVCPDGCIVEPDGTCPHGKPSILMALGLI